MQKLENTNEQSLEIFKDGQTDEPMDGQTRAITKDPLG